MSSLLKIERRTGRYQFIDFTRGIVMAIMAWDHVSVFWNRWYQGSEGLMGRAPSFINLTWFLARYVSHFYDWGGKFWLVRATDVMDYPDEDCVNELITWSPDYWLFEYNVLPPN